jgi:hypothetical protein
MLACSQAKYILRKGVKGANKVTNLVIRQLSTSIVLSYRRVAYFFDPEHLDFQSHFLCTIYAVLTCSDARMITMHSKLPEVLKFGCLQQKVDF